MGIVLSISQTCENCRCFTFSSSDAVTATCGACCRLSAASPLCDLPTERHKDTLKNQAKAEEVNASDTDHALTLEFSFHYLTFPSKGGM